MLKKFRIFEVGGSIHLEGSIWVHCKKFGSLRTLQKGFAVHFLSHREIFPPPTVISNNPPYTTNIMKIKIENDKKKTKKKQKKYKIKKK